MKNNILDRIFSILTYWSAGFFGIIYLIFAYMTKRTTSSFLLFNIYQSLFISILLYILSFVYGIFVNLTGVIPFVGKMVIYADNIIFRQPMVFGFSISGVCLLCLFFYLAICCIIYKEPFIPFVSQIVKENFGG